MVNPFDMEMDTEAVSWQGQTRAADYQLPMARILGAVGS
jgi:hypothetical protein